MDPKGKKDGTELGGMEGRETVVRIYVTRKEPIFNFQKKNQREKGLKRHD